MVRIHHLPPPQKEGTVSVFSPDLPHEMRDGGARFRLTLVRTGRLGAIDPLGVHRPAFTPQQERQAPIPKAHPYGRQLFQTHFQRPVVPGMCSVNRFQRALCPAIVRREDSPIY